MRTICSADELRSFVATGSELPIEFLRPEAQRFRGHAAYEKVSQFLDLLSAALTEALGVKLKLGWVRVASAGTALDPNSTELIELAFWGESLSLEIPAWLFARLRTNLVCSPEDLVRKLGRQFGQELLLRNLESDSDSSAVCFELQLEIESERGIDNTRVVLSAGALNRLSLYLRQTRSEYIPRRYLAVQLSLAISAAALLIEPSIALGMHLPLAGMCLRPRLILPDHNHRLTLPLEPVALACSSTTLVVRHIPEPTRANMQNVSSFDSRRLNSQLSEIAVSLSVEMGEATLSLRQLIELSTGQILEFDYAGEAGLLLRIGTDAVARGRFVVVENQLKIEVIELISAVEDTTSEPAEPIQSQIA